MLQLLEARNVYIGIVSVSIRDLPIRELGPGPGQVSRAYWACALILSRSHNLKKLVLSKWSTTSFWACLHGGGGRYNRGRKIKRVYIQSYNPGLLGWGFLRLLLRLQLRSLSRDVPSSHLEKDEKLILGHICIYSLKCHSLCYAVLGYTRNRWYGIVWETKYSPFTTLKFPKCEKKCENVKCEKKKKKKENRPSSWI